jgi:hypothetical protein
MVIFQQSENLDDFSWISKGLFLFMGNPLEIWGIYRDLFFGGPLSQIQVF